MTRPNDSILDALQLETVKRHADRLLREASARGRFPTPIDDLMVAAKVTVVTDEVLDERALRRFLRRAKAGVAAVKTALSKVLGLFDSHDRLVVIDKHAPKPRVPFVKLHEAGHGTLPHQSKIYRLIHDCEQTLDADIRDLFEREANVFASEVLFQGAEFSEEAHGQAFGIKVPIALARKFGSSNYAAFRRYVATSPSSCCVVILEPPEWGPDGSCEADVRRVIMSESFEAVFDGELLCSRVTDAHPLRAAIPAQGRRMSFERRVILVDRNGDDHECLAEALDTKHQTLVLIRDIGRRTRSGIVLPRVCF